MNAIELIAAERKRQITQEGWTPEHDDKHVNEELLRAAVCYAMYEINDGGYAHAAIDEWPWDPIWFKHKGPIRNLVRAAALVAAEIDRLRRKALRELNDKYHQKRDTPSDISGHMDTLRMYAQRCSHVTELGVRTVVSTWAFLAGLAGSAAFAQSPTLVSVDIAAPEKHGGTLKDVTALALAVGIQFSFQEADDRQIDIAPTDLLFIDTWHVYDQLKVELARHAPRARKFIILHDTETFGVNGETPGHRGLKPAIEEFMQSEEGKQWIQHEHFKHCNGLTVLARML